MEFVVVVGAGASYGAGGVFPRRPPLGAHLYGELRSAYPDTWEALDPAIDAVFASTNATHGFEAGMDAAWYQQWHPHRELWDLGLFFNRFFLNPHARSGYDDLLAILRQRGILSATTFISLNYETLLEQAMRRVGLPIWYGIEGWEG